ncbi:hypothetical protein M501DRAFT_1008430 [Patellaria atrata CBS 101060]|uniref:Uncharacterized protein n=1 Tax=Patellaria atrata CBS 101060 TaxID=1346257 RepID=A0A9P4SJ57_9PEZI|nr:hypothetical protein M501DRAFT_1008430 [Patellaria atrata CBS 101060]
MSGFFLQKTTPAAIHAVAESNFSLNHMNFDFSLIKMNYPVELQPLENLLSSQRRASAENGYFHILARRLGALIDDVLPEVPVLLKAYGTRASEIAQNASVAQGKSKSIVEGLFATQIGVDSTTIGVTATSGMSALRMHLLACLLARLVQYRQKTIIQSAEDEGMINNSMAYAAASQIIDIAIAEHEIPSTSKEQFKDDLYRNIISNFILALSTMEKLVKGQPQRIQTGGVLLAFLSWHIYPDLVVLGMKTTDIVQADSLVNSGGVITIAIAGHDPNPRGDSNELPWAYCSLSLSSIRYYGLYAGMRTSTFDSTRLSITQLQLVAFGSFMKPACVTDLILYAKIIRRIYTVLYSELLLEAKGIKAKNMCTIKDLDGRLDTVILAAEDTYHEPHNCLSRAKIDVLRLLHGFRQGLNFLLSDDAHELAEAMKLVNYGVRHAYGWLGNDEGRSITDVLGLSDISKVLPAVKTPKSRPTFSHSPNRPMNEAELFETLIEEGGHGFEDKEMVFHDFFYGNPTFAAVYRVRNGNSYTLDQKHSMDEATILPLNMLDHLLGYRYDRIKTSLRLFGRISAYYEEYLPEATVSMRAITRSIYQNDFASGVLSGLEGPTDLEHIHTKENRSDPEVRIFSRPLTSTQAFLCILYFESGTISALEEKLERKLLSDPFPQQNISNDAVEHVVGNVGKQGIALLAPPEKPEVRQHAIGEWHYSTHTRFDGLKGSGLFDDTSLHLSFTGYEVPLQLGSNNIRGKEAYFLETRLALNDKHHWVGDLDILKALDDIKTVKGLGAVSGLCGHDPSYSMANIEAAVTSIDCWEELLDAPDGVMVLRADSSWMARLGAVSIAHQKQYMCKYLPTWEEICWTCVMEAVSSY